MWQTYEQPNNGCPCLRKMGEVSELGKPSRTTEAEKAVEPLPKTNENY